MPRTQYELGDQTEKILSDTQRRQENKSQDLITLFKDVDCLDLSKKLKSIDDLSPLTSALKANRSIKSLNLGDNNLNGQRLILILQALLNNKVIRTLDFNRNGIFLRDAVTLKLYVEKCYSPFIELFLGEKEERGKLSEEAIKHIYSIRDNRKKLWEEEVIRLIKETNIFIEKFKFSQDKKNFESKTLKESSDFISYWQKTRVASFEELGSLVYNITKIFLLLGKTSHAMKLLYKFLQQNVGKKNAALLSPEFCSLILPDENEDIKSSLQYILEIWPTVLRCLQNLDTKKQQEWCERFYNHYAGGEPKKDITFIPMCWVNGTIQIDGAVHNFVKSLQDISAPTKEQREFVQYYEALKIAVEKDDLDTIYNLSINSEGETQPLFKKIMRNYYKENQLIIIETLPIILKKMIASEQLENIGDQTQEKPSLPSYVETGLFKKREHEEPPEGNASPKKKKR